MIDAAAFVSFSEYLFALLAKMNTTCFTANKVEWKFHADPYSALEATSSETE
jgi:hypothetical protein